MKIIVIIMVIMISNLYNCLNIFVNAIVLVMMVIAR